MPASKARRQTQHLIPATAKKPEKLNSYFDKEILPLSKHNVKEYEQYIYITLTNLGFTAIIPKILDKNDELGQYMHDCKGEIR